MMQRRFLRDCRKLGFSAMVSARALMRLLAMDSSLAHAGMSPHRIIWSWRMACCCVMTGIVWSGAML